MNASRRWERVRELAERWAEHRQLHPSADRAGSIASWEPDVGLRAEALDFLDALDEEAAERARFTRKVETAFPERIGGYTILRMLGRGGSATVYEARDENGGDETVALKLLHAWVDEAGRERFLREQRILSMLRHEGITAVLDAGITESGQPYLAMERVQGETLDQYCRTRQLRVEERIRLMAEVCEIVEAAHRKLVVHLDLKPGNIMVTADGRIRLLDFGTAKLLDTSAWMTTTRSLTPVYASPEQLRAEPVSTACDIYSAGLVLYELLTGSWPYAGRSSLIALAERAAETASGRPLSKSVTEEAAREQAATPDQLRRYLAGDIEAVVEKALAPAAQRYASIRDLGSDLRRFLEGHPVQAKRQTRRYRFQRFLSRNRNAVAAVALLGCALAWVSAFALAEQRERLLAAQQAERTAGFTLSVLGGLNPLLGGRPDMRASELIDVALRRLRSSQTPKAGDLELRARLAYQLFHTGRPEQGMSELEQVVGLARARKLEADLFAALATMLTLKISVGDCSSAVAIAHETDGMFPAQASRIGPVGRASYRLNRAQVLASCERGIEQAVRMAEETKGDLSKVDRSGFTGGIPGHVFVALSHNARSMLLSVAKRLGEARVAAEEGLAALDGEPDANGVRIALLRSIAQMEGLAGNSKAAAAVLGQAVSISEGVTSPFERLRLKLMWASRMAESGSKDQALKVGKEVVEQLPRLRDEIGAQEFMLLIDAMRVFLFSEECGEVFPLGRRVDALTRGNLPAAWKSTRLLAEGICLVDSGRKREALPLLEEAMRHSPPGEKSEAGRRLARALEAARR